MKKVIRNGKVAVLYSPGYGAGWYSWNTESIDCLFHPEIVKLVEEDRKEEITVEFIQNLLGIEYFYAGGARDLKISWIDENTLFRIDEYDGYESIEIMDSDNYILA